MRVEWRDLRSGAVRFLFEKGTHGKYRRSLHFASFLGFGRDDTKRRMFINVGERIQKRNHEWTRMNTK